MAMAQKPIRSLVAAMTPEELFTAALGLGQQWRVVECRFEGEPKRLELRLEHVRGQHFECPQCRTLCGVHDTIERRWRHLNFFQYHRAGKLKLAVPNIANPQTSHRKQRKGI
jgi:transposase